MSTREKCIEKLERIHQSFEEIQELMLQSDIPLVFMLKMPMSSVKVLIHRLQEGDLPSNIPRRKRPAAPKNNLLK